MTTQAKFEYTRGLEKQIEKQEALIEHLRETILAYSNRIATISNIK